MIFNAKEFELSHGTKPKGYGLWLFDITVNGKPYEQLSFTGKFRDACDYVVSQINPRGIIRAEIVVTVLP